MNDEKKEVNLAKTFDQLIKVELKGVGVITKNQKGNEEDGVTLKEKENK